MNILDHNNDILLAKMDNGDEFFIVNKIHQDITEFAETTRTSRSGEHLLFKQPVYLVINKYNPKRQTIEAIYFARKVQIGSIPNLRLVTIDSWAREILTFQEKETITIPPRLNWVITYPKEIVISNFKDCGQTGWLTTRHEISELARLLPPRFDSGISKKMWLAYTSDKRILYHWDSQPTKDYNIDEIIEIEYDSVSLRCRTITCLTSGRQSGFAMYKSSPPQYLHLRDRFTISMLPAK